MLPMKTRQYVLFALQGTPDVLDRLLQGRDPADPIWDIRPDPARFSLREVVAHLADWEPIWIERVTRVCREDEPDLPDRDEGRIAVENDYAHSDPAQSLARFRRARPALLDFLRAAPEEAWPRVGYYMGSAMSLEVLAVQAAAHDGYHLHQVAQWLAPAT